MDAIDANDAAETVESIMEEVGAATDERRADMSGEP